MSLNFYEITPECRAVANYILEEVHKYNESKELFRDKIKMHTKRLQRILYFCDIEYMKEHQGKPLFQDNYYAWPSGPVVPNVYKVFMQYQDGEMKPEYNEVTIPLTEDIKKIIDRVLEETKEMDTLDLAQKSNVEGGPWSKKFNPDEPECLQVISKKDIYDYYKYNQKKKIKILSKFKKTRK